jgi:hypothetical protein
MIFIFKTELFNFNLNTKAGKLDWEILSEEYDYQQELGKIDFLLRFTYTPTIFFIFQLF